MGGLFVVRADMGGRRFTVAARFFDPLNFYFYCS